MMNQFNYFAILEVNQATCIKQTYWKARKLILRWETKFGILFVTALI